MTYTPTQLAHARVIAQTVHVRGFPERVLVICLETALAESNLLVYANENNPESLRLPHDAVGSDHASVGIFQQQVPMWGTTADCMDPAKSCGKFLHALVQHNWQSMSNWQAAQAVQVSAYPDGSNYRQHDAAARTLAAQLWSEVTDVQLTDTVKNPVTGKQVPVSTYLAAIAVTEATVQKQAQDIAQMKATLAQILAAVQK